MERRIEASTIIGATSEQVGRFLLDHPLAALPNPSRIAVGGVRRDVVVTIDDPEVEDGRVVLPIAWRSAEHAGLFPTFLGTLEAEPSVGGTRLALVGRYGIPLGFVGRFGDGLVGRRLAHEAIRHVLGGIATRVSAALDVVDDAEVDVLVVEGLPSDATIG